jgi:hypothetical protein
LAARESGRRGEEDGSQDRLLWFPYWKKEVFSIVQPCRNTRDFLQASETYDIDEVESGISFAFRVFSEVLASGYASANQSNLA